MLQASSKDCNVQGMHRNGHEAWQSYAASYDMYRVALHVTAAEDSG